MNFLLIVLSLELTNFISMDRQRQKEREGDGMVERHMERYARGEEKTDSNSGREQRHMYVFCVCVHGPWIINSLVVITQQLLSRAKILTIPMKDRGLFSITQRLRSVAPRGVLMQTGKSLMGTWADGNLERWKCGWWKESSIFYRTKAVWSWWIETHWAPGRELERCYCSWMPRLVQLIYNCNLCTVIFKIIVLNHYFQQERMFRDLFTRQIR